MKNVFMTFPLWALLSLSICQPVMGMSEKDTSSILTGIIVISVLGNQELFEYTYTLKTSTLETTCDACEDVPKNQPERARESWLILKKDDQSLPLEKATGLFSPHELLSISNVFLQACIGKCEINTIHTIEPLTDMKTIDAASRSLKYTLIIPNKQRTYALESGKGLSKGSGAIVDIGRKEIITPFCGNRVKELEWSPDGRFIAYSIGMVEDVHGNTLVIYDPVNRKVILEKNLGELITSLAWSPSSNTVAVLTKKTRFFSLNPFNLLMFLGGHPIEYGTFSLAIFNFEHEMKSIKTFLKDVKNASGVILWE